MIQATTEYLKPISNWTLKKHPQSSNDSTPSYSNRGLKFHHSKKEKKQRPKASTNKTSVRKKNTTHFFLTIETKATIQ